jgi:type IV secretion system protein VirD4
MSTESLTALHNGALVLLIVIASFLAVQIVRPLMMLLARGFGLSTPSLYLAFPRLPWRVFARPCLWLAARFDELFRAGKRSTARWAGWFEARAQLLRPGNIYVGNWRWCGLGMFMPVGVAARRHLSVIASSGAGKTNALVSMVSQYAGNALVIDPKATITKALLSRVGNGAPGIIGKNRRALVFDPRGISGFTSARWNPLAEVEAQEQREPGAAVRWCAKIANVLIQDEGSDQKFFTLSARVLVQGLCLHVMSTEPAGRKTLGRVRELLTEGDRTGPASACPHEFLRLKMKHNPSFGGMVRRCAESVFGGSEVSAADVFATARAQTAFLDDGAVERILEASDFSLLDVKYGDVSLFLTASVGDLAGELSGLFRLMVTMAFDLFEANNAKRPKHPTLFVLDELPSIGHVDAIDRGPAVLRGYGVALVAVAQDLEVLQKAYPQSWGGFLGNAEAVLAMGSNHPETLEYFSSMLGQSTRRCVLGRKRGKGSPHETEQDRPLMTPDQLKRYFSGDNMVLFRFGQRPMKLKVPHYFKELAVFEYEPDPGYAEPTGRALMRAFLRSAIPGPANHQTP